MNGESNPIPSRGATDNPANRFEKIHLERDLDWNSEDETIARHTVAQGQHQHHH